MCGAVRSVCIALLLPMWQHRTLFIICHAACTDLSRSSLRNRSGVSRRKRLIQYVNLDEEMGEDPGSVDLGAAENVLAIDGLLRDVDGLRDAW